MLKIREGKVKGCRRGGKAMAQLGYKKRGRAHKVGMLRKILVTKAAKREGPTHTANLFRGDYAKNQEDPSRGWRGSP